VNAASSEPDTVAFAASSARFELILGWLDGDQAAGLTHAELEDQLDAAGRELLRQLLQDHLDLRAQRETRAVVVDAAGLAHGAVEAGHARALETVFGQVEVRRLAYRRRGHPNLHPADATLNLPAERHSHGLRRLAAVEASRGSFDAAVAAIGRASGQALGKRQVEQLTARAAVDFDDYYTSRMPPAAEAGDVLVMTCDGKGIVMRADALRAATAQAAVDATPKLGSRLSKGEKRNRKRMATVASVYDLTPVPRTPADVMACDHDDDTHPTPAPTAKGKWLMASVVNDAAAVVDKMFDEAQRRDPTHTRTWIALVDGNNHQIDRILAEARTRGVDVTIVIDFVHVLEYIWSAAWSFFDEGDPQAEAWVRDKAREILNGNATRVAGAIRRKATYHRLDTKRRINADKAATYLTNKAPHLDYADALAHGWPIATGVIEGACRHLVKDRMDITGARWGLEGAEAVLKLRALISNGDFDAYWRMHLTREHQRVHQPRYAPDTLPQAA
jgi:hypothetical protein